MKTVERPTRARREYALRVVTLTLALACGLTVANIYYAQPLLDLIAHSFGISQGSASIVVTATQFGYALGLAFLLPLGDLLENRTLASRMLIGTALVLLVAAFAPNYGLFLAASVLIGITSVVVQILIPFAAHLAPPEQRGRFVGQVMSGLLLGILLARTVSSLVAAQFGWRAIYLISAVLMIVLSLVLREVLPTRRPDTDRSYTSLLRSVLHLARTEPVLRRRAIAHALLFGAFSSFWTSIAYELIDAHGLSQNEIGVFALVGAAGALAAPIGGWLGDRGHGRVGRIVALLLATAAMVLAAVGASSLILLAVAAIVLDLSVQAHQVLCQRDIYALHDDARARINTVFMTTIFIGGALASAISGLLHDQYGWTGVALFGAALPAIGAVLWCADRPNRKVIT